MVAYVASPLAAGVTAQALNVCGGLGNYLRWGLYALSRPPPASSLLWIVCLAENDTVSESLLADDGERARLSPSLSEPGGVRSCFDGGAAARLGPFERLANRAYPGGQAAHSRSAAASLQLEQLARVLRGGRFGGRGRRRHRRPSTGVDCRAWRAVCPGFVGPAGCPEAVRQLSGRWHWAQFEARLKLRGGRLFDALSALAEEPGSTYCHEVVVAAASYICAIARSVPFRLARLEILPFAKVGAYAE